MNSPAIQSTDEPAAKTRLRLWLRLLKVSRTIENQLRENLRTEFRTTLPRFDVMAALYRYPKGMRMTELSGILKVSNGNVTGIVERLVNDGLVIRNAVPGDRRALLVCLTKSGQEEFIRQAEQHENWIDELLEDVPVGDAQTILQMLDFETPTLSKEDEEV